MSDYTNSLRRLRREPIVEPDRWPDNLDGGRRLLDEVLPHAGPMLLVDELAGWDADDELLVAHRHIEDDHIGLEGHFPDDPVLPGTLMLEMLGQAGTALFALLLEEHNPDQQFDVRATKVHGAHFVCEARPGDRIDLVVRAREWDTFLGECDAQAIVDGQVVAAMIGELAVL